MLDQANATLTPHKRLPWNKGKLTGARPPLRPKHVWSIRTKLQIEGRARDLAMFKLAIDSKLRGCNLAHERPLCAMSGPSDRVHSYRNLLSIAVDEGFLGRRATWAAQMPLLDRSRANNAIEERPRCGDWPR